MKTITFSVDAAAILIEVERWSQAEDPSALGVRFGLREIRRGLHAIATRALEVGDETIIAELAKLGCLKEPEREATP